MPTGPAPVTPQLPDRPGSSSSNSSNLVRGADVVATVRTQLGKPYEFGSGPSTDTFDCSDLMQWAYKQHGIRIPRVTADQVKIGAAVQRNQIQAGDLIFSNWIGRPHSHVGIYDGNGNIIQAPKTGDVVKVTKLGPGYWSHVDAIRRVPGVVGGPAGTVTVPAGGSGGGGGPIGDLFGAITRVLSPAEAATAALAPLRTVADAATNVGAAAMRINNLFLPTSIMRGVAGVAGGIFILIGIFFLAREAKR